MPGAALEAALDALSTGGVESISLRKVAARIGVAHRSLYNHFEDRAALLRALAAEGFRGLGGSLERAQTAPSFRRRYLRFALENRHLYALMMSPHGREVHHEPALQSPVERVISLALAMFTRDGEDATAARRAVMAEWMFLHGAASLHLSGILQKRSDTAFLAEVEQIGVYAPSRDAKTP